MVVVDEAAGNDEQTGDVATGPLDAAPRADEVQIRKCVTKGVKCRWLYDCCTLKCDMWRGKCVE